MDQYVAEFYKMKDNCQVKDYAVFLEKKTGFQKLNPFHVHEQLVVYLTDKGVFASRVRGMGEFTHPEPDYFLGLWLEDKCAISDALDKTYTFIRKWKDGCTDSYWDFFRAVHGK